MTTKNVKLKMIKFIVKTQFLSKSSLKIAIIIIIIIIIIITIINSSSRNVLGS
jgi:hypothetical protein